MTPSSHSSGPPAKLGRGACVLIAEDDAEINGLLAEAMREAGCEVVQAFDGMDAYELARERRPGVIVMDLDLPRLYGHVVMRGLRRDPATANIPVVVLTDRPELLSREDAGLLGLPVACAGAVGFQLILGALPGERPLGQ